MTVDLTPELEQLVRSKVESGRYDSASDVVRQALRLLEHRDEVFTLGSDEIRTKIDESRSSAFTIRW